jgi:hypothetical protein
VEECRAIRRRLALPLGLWTNRTIAESLQAAADRGWPLDTAGLALLAIAADPTTRGPARLAAPGPWWEAAERTTPSDDHAGELDALEARLAEADGHRVSAQREAHRRLTAAGTPSPASPSPAPPSPSSTATPSSP